MAEEYETLLHRWFEEVWNNQSESAIDEMLAEGTVVNGLSDTAGNPIVGPEGFKVFHRAFLSAFNDIHVTVEDSIAEGDKVAIRCSVKMTHTGEGIGVAPTNQAIEFTGLGFAKIKDGKIVEAWNEFDFMKMYRQLGALTLNLQ